MIRSLSDEQMKRWDEYIPYFLFSYREVPCKTTGYSPFELLYGRQIRGPLSILKESWVSMETPSNDVVNQLLHMRKRVSELLKNANENTEQSQKKMKMHYDKNSIQRDFSPGDQVLIFLPEGPSKLDCKWQGPYNVIRRLDLVNYELCLPEKRKSRLIVHVNLIKKWYNRDHERKISKFTYVMGKLNEISGEDNSYRDECKEDETVLEIDSEVGPAMVQTQTWKDVQIGDKLSHEQIIQMKGIVGAYRDIFTDIPGKTHLVEHHIKTHTDTPVRQNAYRVPHALRDPVKQEIESMLHLGIIEPTSSSYASPIVVVTKQDGSLRLCTDFRKLHKMCIFDPYTMPRTDEILDEVASAKFISTLDLTKDFYQIPLDRESRDKTSFVSPFGQYRYTVLPFGLQNSSSTFQRLMDQVLLGCEEFARAYIDDICIFSKTWQNHLKHLHEVFEKLRKANLSVKPKKSKVAMQQVEYLGHTIGNGTVSPICNKLEGVHNFPQPLVKRDVRAFLGLTGYYRKFVPNYAAIAKPLTDLTKKCTPNKIIWNDECQIAFESLKRHLTSRPVLGAPDFDREFMVQTDASQFGLGGSAQSSEGRGYRTPNSIFE